MSRLFSKKLRILRENKHWTRYHLAMISGVEEETINSYESGRVNNPTIKNALKLAKALGRTVEYILDDECKTEQKIISDPTIIEIASRLETLDEKSIKSISDYVSFIGDTQDAQQNNKDKDK